MDVNMLLCMYSGCRLKWFGSDHFLLFRCKAQVYVNGGDNKSHEIKNQQPIEHNTITHHIRSSA